MPYTPPSHPSPASSASASPNVSRRSSFQSGTRPSLPRSASYLNKHRRTPSVTALGHVESESAASAVVKASANPSLGGSVRQSPSPPVDDRELMPKGAIVSPPESAASGSDDDELPEIQGRDRDTLKSLRDAVCQIPLPATPPASSQPHREPRPDMETQELRGCFSTSSLDDLPKAGRKLGHVRSATESIITMPKTPDGSMTGSEEDTDEDLKYKPQMVRKKSGELVRPALRASRRRPSSMPGTPVYSKAVHFDSHLEHVRHFLQVDRPLAVSAGSSPVESYESDNEYPFPGNGSGQPPRSPPFEWELVTASFPHDSPLRRRMPARLEKVWLSSDQKSLLGSIAVANLAFHKHVTCRFTLDYWKTVSEVGAQYGHEIRPREGSLGHDRFNFAIKLSDMANLESKTLFLCVRYTVDGQEYWDNNNSANFQVDFRKKHLPQNGKNNFQGAASRSVGGLPRSNRRQSSGSGLRPVSMPVPLDAFGSEPDKFHFGQPIHEYLGESGPLRLKTKSSTNLASDNIASSLTSPSGAAFSNRYDFGASLSAAMQVAKDSMAKDRDTLYMKRNVRGFEPAPDAPRASDTQRRSNDSASGSGSRSPNLSLPSASYEELVNKYCFFGSSRPSPTLRDTSSLESGVFDGHKGRDETTKAAGSHRGPSPTAMHHSIHLPYQGAHLPSPMTSAPASTATQETARAGPKDQWATSTTVGASRSRTPTLISGTGTPASDTPYHNHGSQLADRFPWTTDSQAATAIRG